MECLECEVKNPFDDEVDLDMVFKFEDGNFESEMELLKDLEDVE